MVPIRRHARHWLAYLAGGGLVLILGASAPTGEPTQHRAEDTQATNTAAKANQASPQHAASATHSEDTLSKQRRSNPATSNHDSEGPKWTDMATALAAIVSAGFAFALWRSTDKLWVETKRLAVGAENQATDFKRSVDASERAASAALGQAAVAEDAFKTSNRPWLIVEPSMVGSSEQGLVYDLVNYGNSPALVRDIVSVLICPNHLVNEQDIDNNFSFRHADRVIAPSGKQRCSATAPPNSAPFPNGQRVYAVGRINYEGVNGIRCMTLFCLEYHSGTKQFYETDNPPNLNRRT